jgi:simple sugar transport system ATP-binding protein
VLLLDEPFQGVDVGARADIAKAVRAQEDIATLVATSDPEEALEVADRIFVLDSRGLRPFGVRATIDRALSSGSQDGFLE